MRAQKKSHVLSGFVLCSALAGCVAPPADDQSMFLTGTEEHAITLADGEKGCTNPKKVLVCHIPPGNPANAHDICVSAHAVEPHQARHGDTTGACVAEPPPDAGTGSDDGGVIF